MPIPTPEEIDTRSYIGTWCEHCRCTVAANRISQTYNHIACGKGPVENIALVILPVRDFS